MCVSVAWMGQRLTDAPCSGHLHSREGCLGPGGAGREGWEGAMACLSAVPGGDCHTSSRVMVPVLEMQRLFGSGTRWE